MFPSIAVILQRRDTALKLKEHVKANDHHLFEVRVCNLVIKEMLCNEFTVVVRPLGRGSCHRLSNLIPVLISFHLAAFELARDRYLQLFAYTHI